jgi:hypothetical protein
MDSILHPDHRITRSDAAMLDRLTDTHETVGRRWMAQLTETHRNAIVAKIIASIQDLQRGDRQDMKILARLSLVLARFDDLDLRREQGAAPNTINNTQINISAASSASINKALESKDGRDALARLRDVIQDGHAAVVGEA